LWGKGVYFAVNANYSCPGYSYKIPNTNTYEVFNAYVITGDAYDSGSQTNGKLREPPKDSKGQSHDSVKGHTNGSEVFIVY
jgi:hypothetical protein